MPCPYEYLWLIMLGGVETKHDFKCGKLLAIELVCLTQAY